MRRKRTEQEVQQLRAFLLPLCDGSRNLHVLIEAVEQEFGTQEKYDNMKGHLDAMAEEGLVECRKDKHDVRYIALVSELPEGLDGFLLRCCSERPSTSTHDLVKAVDDRYPTKLAYASVRDHLKSMQQRGLVSSFKKGMRRFYYIEQVAESLDGFLLSYCTGEYTVEQIWRFMLEYNASVEYPFIEHRLEYWRGQGVLACEKEGGERYYYRVAVEE